MPALVGKNIDQVRKVLGQPTDKEKEPSKLQMKMNVEEWDNSFKKEGKSLLVTFNPKTREIIDFFIDADDFGGMTSDYTGLLQLGNVSENDPKYTIEPVRAIKDSEKFTGVKIIPK